MIDLCGDGGWDCRGAGMRGWGVGVEGGLEVGLANRLSCRLGEEVGWGGWFDASESDSVLMGGEGGGMWVGGSASRSTTAALDAWSAREGEDGKGW